MLMAQKISIAAIGDRESVMLFNALGIHAVYADEVPKAEKAIHRLAREGCSVIYITEQLAELVPEVLGRYATQAFPTIIPIPNRMGSTGFGMKGIRANVEKAIGADILFEEEGKK